MSINWHLKSYLSTKHSIYTPTELKKVILKKTGVIVSLPNISRLLSKKPTLIKFEMMEIICSALDCKLSDFMNIGPKKFKNIDVKTKYSYKNTPLSKRGSSSFPLPKDYN